MGQGVLLFDVTSGSAAASAPSFVQDAFQDYVVPPNANSGLSSTALTNPLGQYFANDNCARYATKTLWIKDLVLVQDRTQWLTSLTTNKIEPTYQIIWHENFPACRGYATGAPNLVQNQQGNRLDLCRDGDGFGVGGVIRRVEWIVEPEVGSNGTLNKYLDGVSTGTIVVSGGASGWNGVPKYNLQAHETTLEAYNLHDFRIENGSPTVNLSVTGVVVYYEITGLQVDQPGGSAFVNGQLVTTVGTSLSVPANTSFRGGRANFYETVANVFGSTTQFITDVVSIATGTTNTNLLNLSAGTGNSFPIGTAVWIPQGTTQYVGNVLNQSGDVLTMGVTLPFGLSNSIYQLFQAGSTAFPLGTSLFQQSFLWDASQIFPQVAGGSLFLGATFIFNSASVTVGVFGNLVNNVGGVLSATFPVFSYEGPYQNYRIWGGTLQIASGTSLYSGATSTGATYGLEPYTASSFLQVDGFFQGLEMEFYAGTSAVLKATLSIDGLAMYSFNDTVNPGPGFFRKSLFTNAGPGWHSVVLSAGAGMTGVMVTKVVGYESKVPQGPSFGNLSQLYFGQTFIPQQAINATLMSFGNIRRVYADSLNLGGGAATTWVRGTTATAAGGVYYVGSTTTCTLNFNYYGTAFALVGTAGGSYSMVMDGVGTSALFNQWLGTGNSLTFHTIAMTQLGPTLKVDAVDFLSPVGAMKFLPSLGPIVSSQLEPQIPPQALVPQVGLARGSVGSREIGIAGVQTTNVGIGAIQRPNLSPLGLVTSGAVVFSTNTTNPSTPVLVTGLGVTFTTTGRAVSVFCTPDGSGSIGNIVSPMATSNTFIQVVRDGSACIFRTQVGGATNLIVAPSTISTIDPTCPAGVHSWQVYMYTGNIGSTAQINNVVLNAYEL